MCPGAFMDRNLKGALLAGVAGLVMAAAPAVARPNDDASKWAGKVWDAATRGDGASLNELLSTRPAGIDADGRLGKAVDQLKTNLAARETKRAEELTRAGADLDKALGEKDGGDFAICDALKAA